MLIAVDTNVVVRLIVGDDPAQLATARALLDENRLFVPLTVLLETEWVLRSRYRYSRNDVVRALKSLAILEGIMIQRADLAGWAIQRHGRGADFADMIHLAAAGEVDAFATFDGDIGKLAGADAPLRVETLA